MKPFEPIHIDSNAPVEEVKEVPFFYVDDIEYTIPDKVPASIVTQYFKDVRNRGEDYALATALIDLCGEEAWDALNESPNVNDQQMQQIMGILSELLMGGMKKALGKSRSARRQQRG